MIGKIIKYVNVDKEAIFAGTVVDKIRISGDDYYIVQRQAYYIDEEESWYSAGNGIDRVSPLDVTEVIDELPM